MHTISKYSIDEFDSIITDINDFIDVQVPNMKTTTSNNINEVKAVYADACDISLNQLNAKANIADIINFTHPVGSIMRTQTNATPTIGGSWTLIGKNFTPGSLTSSVFAINTTNCSSLSSVVAMRAGNSIRLRVTVVNKVAFSDSSFEVGTFNLTTLGVKAMAQGQAITIFGQSDGANTIPIATVTGDGVLTHTDSIGEDTVVAGSSIIYDFMIAVPFSDMVDGACNQFIWERTA